MIAVVKRADSSRESLPTSFHTKGTCWQMKKAFMYHSVSWRDISISLQWSCAIPFSFLIPRNLAIKDKICSIFYTGYYYWLLHENYNNVYFCQCLYDFRSYDTNFHSPFWHDFLGGPNLTDLGMCIILNWMTTKYPWVKADAPSAFRWSIFQISAYL